MLVAIEILSSLCEIDAKMTSKAVLAYFSLPVSLVQIDKTG
jgi:hypothetical protein